jgi:hypothetical protein
MDAVEDAYRDARRLERGDDRRDDRSPGERGVGDDEDRVGAGLADDLRQLPRRAGTEVRDRPARNLKIGHLGQHGRSPVARLDECRQLCRDSRHT